MIGNDDSIEYNNVDDVCESFKILQHIIRGNYHQYCSKFSFFGMYNDANANFIKRGNAVLIVNSNFYRRLLVNSYLMKRSVSCGVLELC